MKQTKRVLTILLAVVMVLCSVPVAFGANIVDSGTCGDNLTWTLDDEGTLTISGTGEMYNYVLEDMVNAPWCNVSLSDLVKNVVINNGVTSIGRDAFRFCHQLETVTIPNTVTSIGAFAFYDCVKLQTVSLPKSVTWIGKYCFSNCSQLSSISVDKDNENYSSLDGVLYNKNKTELIRYPACKNAESFNMPESLIVIDDDAFAYSRKLKNISFGDNITTIGEEAFEYCSNLISVIIPDRVTNISFECFSGCSGLTSVDLGRGVTRIWHGAFQECNNLETVIIPDTVTRIDDLAFSNCNLRDIYYRGTEAQWNNIDYTRFITGYNQNAVVHYNYNPNPTATHTVTYNYTRNGGTSATALTATVAEGAAIDLTPTATKSGWTFVGWNTNPSATTALSSLTMGTSDVTLYAIFRQNVNIYNLGEETYSFQNYVDSDSRGGHCFGMSSTSSMYYLGLLNPSLIGISSSDKLYTVSSNDTVKKPICHYQGIQGSYSNGAIVAGGSWYLYKYNDIASDWAAVVNYVKNHSFDNKGGLQIGFRKSTQGGHAINFLRYEVVNGQERIYAYDNNFPTVETYFYKDDSGNVWEKPYSTFSGSIDCIALRDVATYYRLAGSFDASLAFYAAADEIVIENAEAYAMECGPEGGEYYMFELSSGSTQAQIVPQKDNATFTYLDQEYIFSTIDDDTYGIVTLSSMDEGGAFDNPTFTIYNAPGTQPDQPADPGTPESACPWCGGQHVGFFAGIIAWFHGLLARIFGARF